MGNKNRVSATDRMNKTFEAMTSVNNNVNNDVKSEGEKMENNLNDNILNNSPNVNVNKEVKEIVNNNVNKEVISSETESSNNEVYETKADINTDIIIEVKKVKKIVEKRQTYFLTEETIDLIEKISKKSGMKKSELVEKILNNALKKIKITN